MQRLVFACAVALLAITSYRWIIVNADDATTEASVMRKDENTTTGKPGVSPNSSTVGSVITTGLNLTCPNNTFFPAGATYCLQTVPLDTSGQSTVSLSTCKMVDASTTTCQCSTMAYNGASYPLGTSGAGIVYLLTDTCKSLGATNCIGCVTFDTNNTAAATPAPKKAGTGGASNVATNGFLIMSALFPLLPKAFPLG